MIRLNDVVKARLEKIAARYDLSMGKTVSMLVDGFVMDDERLEYFSDGGVVMRISGLDGKTTAEWKRFVGRAGPIMLADCHPTMREWKAFVGGRDG